MPEVLPITAVVAIMLNVKVNDLVFSRHQKRKQKSLCQTANLSKLLAFKYLSPVAKAIILIP